MSLTFHGRAGFTPMCLLLKPRAAPLGAAEGHLSRALWVTRRSRAGGQCAVSPLCLPASKREVEPRRQEAAPSVMPPGIATCAWLCSEHSGAHSCPLQVPIRPRDYQAHGPWAPAQLRADNHGAPGTQGGVAGPGFSLASLSPWAWGQAFVIPPGLSFPYIKQGTWTLFF